ncbi:MAG: CDP-glycerol glycerophosphotransferase family protein [Lachnospiraceae bacterium]|nr:CDP-glycerol glycerophosphotransferase family protein [Lachnospiraceae bacterium]
MRLNDETEVLIDKLAIRRNIMTLGVLVRNTAGKPEELEIKLAVKFDNGSESRILPLSVTDTSFDENGAFIGYAIFDYELDALFFSNNLNAFTVVVQAYDGQAYQDVVVEGKDFNQVKDENEYACLTENGVIHIKRKKPVKYHKNILTSVFCLLYRVVEFLIGTLLIPLFVLDGIYVHVLGNKRRYMENTYGGGQLKRTLLFAKWRYSSFCRLTMNRATIKKTFLNLLASFLSLFFSKNHILFVSSRRTDLTGNIAYVNNILQEKNAKVLFWLIPGKTKHMTYRAMCSLAYKLARSKVVVVDDFTPILNEVWVMEKRTLIQLWHACGAFKTFGFTRVGKDGGPNQTSTNHRYYDYAIVSSTEISRFYAEGFGISERNVKALGVPRTDDFFKKEYMVEIKDKLYNDYPQLKGKKIVLFAPTFRGNGAGTAHFPFEKFDAKKVLEQLGDEYMIIIKHHPFVEMRHPVDESVKDRVLDLSTESEINDLLFITDLLITDYSSVIFEASLLDIPMLFYAFDLEDYVVNRDFYYPFKNFVPGKIVRNMEQICTAIINEDYELQKVKIFKHRFFDDLDGKSSERVAEFILEQLK